MEIILNKEQIKEVIPHRDPFIMIDAITELKPGYSATALKYVNEDEPHFKGHFPGSPVMPGVLMVEGLAQTGAVAILSLPENKGKLAFFGGIKSCRFKKIVKPGDVLTYKIEITKMKGPVGIGQAKAYVDGQLAVSAELTFALES